MATELTAWQLNELRRYADGAPHRFEERPSANLIRRNLLTSARQTAGPGFYRLTGFGRAVLFGQAVLAEQDPLPVIAEDDLYPRDDEHRYRIYARRGEEIEVLACAGSPEAFGVALVTLDNDERERGRRLVDLGAIGVLDAVEGRWIIMPWHRREAVVSETVGDRSMRKKPEYHG